MSKYGKVYKKLDKHEKTVLVSRCVFYSVCASVIRHSRKLAYGSDSSLGGGN